MANTRTRATTDEHEHGGADRGRQADAPEDIPALGVKDVVLRIKDEAAEDNLTLIAAGVAFFSLLSLVPAMIAGISLYGLVADPTDVVRQVEAFTEAMPEEAATLIREQLEQVAGANQAGLSVGLFGGLAIALWSASTAMKHLMVALSAVYDEDEGRGFVGLRLRALVLTLLGMAFVGVAVFLLTVAPRLAGDAGSTVRSALSWLRWPLLLVMMLTVLSALYRYGPDREAPRWRWVSWGAGIATAIWIVASIGFSVYTQYFGSYNETYGTMAAVVVLMLWLFLTALCVLLGAEINAQLELQTAKDTTTGPAEPRGHRDAHVADTVGEAAGR